MAVTWLYLPWTFSRLGLRNLGMWAWACSLKVYKVFTKVSQCPWLKRKLCLGPTSVINCIPQSTLSFWVNLFPRVFGYNRVGCHVLLQGIFPTQGSNPDLLHYRQILFQLSHKGSTRILERVAYPFSSRSSQPRNRSGVSCKKSYPNITNTIALNLYITKKVLGPHSNI